MAEQQQEHVPTPEEEDADLEYKPVVKYTALGLAVCAFLGLSWALYSIGLSQGFNEGVASQQVAEKLNAAAAQQLAHFMQSASADDAELQELAAHADSKLAWIADKSIRREALWQLAQTLLERRMGDQAAPLLQQLFADAPQETVWTRRMLQTGDAYFAAQDAKTAADWYRRAADRASGEDKLCALSALFTAYSTRGIGCGSLLKEAAALGDTARPLQMVILTYLGEQARSRGDEQEAATDFDKALAVIPDPAKLQPNEQIYYATALVEKGETQKGLEMLNAALPKLGNAPEMLAPRLLGLRQSAAATMAVHNDANAALALLNRADGASEGALPEENAFRSCLSEQRGWLLLLSQEYETALGEFTRALENPTNALLAAQAMEGAARCHLALNQAEPAEEMLRRCAELRGKQAPKDTASLGRVQLLQAQAAEQLNRADEADACYAAAAKHLREAGDTENLITALFGRGYGLVKNSQWPEALDVCQQLTPLVKDKPDRREEARRMLNLCRAHNHLPSKVQDPGNPQETAEAAAQDAAAEAEEADEEEAAAAEL